MLACGQRGVLQLCYLSLFIYLHMNQYYVIKTDGSQAGPVSVSVIMEMLAKGEITTESLAAVPGAASWGKVADILNNPSAAAAALPVPSKTAATWNPLTAFKSCMKRYACFSGRAGRSEYWFYVLAWVLIWMACVMVDACLFLAMPITEVTFWVVTFIPSMAVAWRRMQDSGLCGAHSLWDFIPFVGEIAVLILACRPSSGPNKYGEAPADPVE